MQRAFSDCPHGKSRRIHISYDFSSASSIHQQRINNEGASFGKEELNTIRFSAGGAKKPQVTLSCRPPSHSQPRPTHLPD
jgi:hypothetical protein